MSLKNIGIDFGNTNTAVAYYDDAARELRGVKFNREGQASLVMSATDRSWEYIPSVIAYEKKSKAVVIGKRAKEVPSDKYDVFDNIKIKLLTKPEAVVNGRRIIDVYTDYLIRLVNTYKAAAKEDVSLISLAIPNVMYGLAEVLEEIKKKVKEVTGAEEIRFVKEPEATCAFFAEDFKKSKGYFFRGDLLVTDLGGGTIDVGVYAFSESRGELRYSEKKIDFQPNIADDAKHVGYAFDEAVLKCLPKWENLDGDKKRIYRKNFEEWKISAKTEIDSVIEKYNSRGGYIDLPIDKYVQLSDEDYGEFTAKNIVEAFNSVCRQYLDDRLQEALSVIDNCAHQERFRAVFVGGFSNLSLCEKVFKEHLQIENNDDGRLYELKNDLKVYAIAYGAALLANNSITESEKVGYEVALRQSVFDGGGLRAENKVLIDKNEPIDSYYSKSWTDVYCGSSGSLSLSISTGMKNIVQSVAYKRKGGTAAAKLAVYINEENGKPYLSILQEGSAEEIYPINREDENGA